MKRRMKYFLVCFFVLVGVFGGRVVASAAENKDAEGIVEKCETVMSAKKVLAYEIYMTYEGQREKFMAMSLDKNTKTSYVELLGEEMYLDERNNLVYQYDSGKKKWYVSPADSSEIGLGEEDTDYIYQDIEGAQVTYEYNGTEVFQNVSCEKITIHVKKEDTGEAYNIICYVNQNTYEMCAEIIEQESLIMEILFSYPDAVQIPENVKTSSVLEPGSTVKSGKLQYTVPKSAKGRVVEVSNGSKAASKVTIPDTITFAGKKYKVTGIGAKAFANNKKITKVTIGKNVKAIGKMSFYKCKKLKQVVIRSSKITKIGQKAFYGNAKRLKVKVPKSKLSKYKKLLKKSKVSSKLTVSR